jgi:hypothetical protein
MISVPWKNIMSENIVVKVKDLTILANLDLLKIEEYRQQSITFVQRKILERVESRIIDSFRKAQKMEAGYMGMFLDGLLKRIHFEVENLVVRFEILDMPQLQSAFVLRLRKAFFNTDNQKVEDIEGKNLYARNLQIEGLGMDLERKKIIHKCIS